MSSPPYHGGHSLADLIDELPRRLSLREMQDEIYRQIAAGEIVLSEELPEGWYFEWASLREEGDGWVRLGGRRIMIVVSGKQRDPREFRWHEPPLPVRPEPLFAEEEDLPPLATEAPTIAPAALPPLGCAGHAGHSLADILKGWRRRHSLPIVQAYLAALLASGDIALSENLPSSGWWLEDAPRHHIVIVTPDGWCDPVALRCLFPRDPLLAGPLQLSRLQKPAVEKKPAREPAAPVSVEPDDSSSDVPDRDKAAKWMAALLAKDSKTKKKRHKADCMKQFKITANTYDTWVWCEAHRIAGLPMRGSAAD